MPKKILIFLIFLGLWVCTAPATLAANDPSSDGVADTYYRAEVTRVLETGSELTEEGILQPWQKLELTILHGDKKGRLITINNGKDYVIGTFQEYSEGDVVVIGNPPPTPGIEKEFYYISDRYRAGGLVWAGVLFFALAIYFGRRRGLTSILGMLFSIIVLFYFIIPYILKGGNAFLACILGAVAIALVSLFLSHGFNRRTAVALVSTLLSLGFAVIIDLLFVHIASLTGSGTEEAFYLQLDSFSINLRGILLGGILLGVLGVLDDVTTAQSALVEEIHLTNPTLTYKELYRKGLSVGREHIASLINTLVLAYVGASFPLLLLFGSHRVQPLWITLNSNFIAEEIIRSLVGSATLVVAVPLTTIIAAYYYSRRAEQYSAPYTPLAEQPQETLERMWKK